MAMDAHGGIELLAHITDDGGHLIRQGTTVGIAEGEALGAALQRGLQGGQSIGAVGLVAIEEMLCIVPDTDAMLGEVGNAFADDAQVFLTGAAQHLLHVQDGAFAEDGHHVHTTGKQCGQSGIALGLFTGTDGGAKGHQLGVAQALAAELCKEGCVLGIGGGVAALDVLHAQVVQRQGDALFILQGEGDALRLRTVAQGGVQELDHLPSLRNLQ